MTRPNLLVIRSSDLERARLFYEAMGVRFQVERHGAGPEHLAASWEGFVFEVYPQRSEASTTSTRLGFQVRGLQGLLAALTEQGGTVLREPESSSWGLRAVVRDPDGHTVELLESPEP